MIDSHALMLEATQLNSINKNLELWLLQVKCLGANLSSFSRSYAVPVHMVRDEGRKRVAKQRKKGGKKVGGVIFFSSLFILWSNLRRGQNQ